MNDKVLGHIREARAVLMHERDTTTDGKSRELAVAITKLDEAEMWRERDLARKRPPIDEESRQRSPR